MMRKRFFFVEALAATVCRYGAGLAPNMTWKDFRNLQRPNSYFVYVAAPLSLSYNQFENMSSKIQDNCSHLQISKCFCVHYKEACQWASVSRDSARAQGELHVAQFLCSLCNKFWY